MFGFRVRMLIGVSVLFAVIASFSAEVMQEYSTSIATKEGKNCQVDIDCPFWTKCNNTKCACKENLQNLVSVHCSEELQLSVIRCHCVTFDNITNKLVEGKCMENCDSGYDKSDYLPLPTDVSQLNQFMCEEKWNRTGRLCGRCLPGHSPLAYSYDMRCVKCPEGNRNIWKYVLMAFGPLTIFYVFVLLLKINATSSYIHGFLFYSQLITAPAFARVVTTYSHSLTADIRVCVVLILDIYAIWNLDFFRGLYPDICLDVSTLTILALDYAVAIYPLLLTVISYILIELYARNFRLVVILWRPFHYFFSRFRTNWESRTTIIDAFATFFLLSFVKMSTTSVDLLTPVKVANLLNEKVNVTWMLYYDATIEYFGKEHLPYAILALSCSTLFAILPMLLLLIYQFRWFQRLLSCLKLRHQLLQEVMESFQSCFKNGIEPGTKDLRWFAAVFYIARYINIMLYSSMLDSSYFTFAIVLIFLFMVIMALIQPYKDPNHTKIDIFSLGVLGMFIGINQGTNFESLRPKTIFHASRILRIIVALFPLVVVTCFITYSILSRLRKAKMFMTRIRAWRQGYSSMEQDFETSLPDRLVNPQRYEERNRLLEPI
ncbi:uncharacterized protein LOC135343084 [Halichondria panicea]|uniref:uncharacterized protein LOC135343084 n=1 Tax=Halichondria panicea TaxID=6063 RepID=UPI00312B850C